MKKYSMEKILKILSEKNRRTNDTRGSAGNSTSRSKPTTDSVANMKEWS